ncbi:hypothetical protein AGMMS49944_24490 [Spirochaetia bacterium]|nr:hypothetical protein AGMMS49944_24490 [Spirochaetia bacterium]
MKNRDDGLITVRAAMEIMGIPTRHEFNKLILNKKLPCTMIGKHIWVAREDVDTMIANQGSGEAAAGSVEHITHEKPDTLLTPREVIEILRISRATFFTLLKKKKIAYSKVGERYRISREDLEQYLAENYVPREHGK